jgi:hypothetical protein
LPQDAFCPAEYPGTGAFTSRHGGNPTAGQGAVDRPADGIVNWQTMTNWLGFRLTKNTYQLSIWEEELRYILTTLSQSNYGGQEGVTPEYNIVQGKWDFVPKKYLMTQICGHPPAANGFCQ